MLHTDQRISSLSRELGTLGDGRQVAGRMCAAPCDDDQIRLGVGDEVGVVRHHDHLERCLAATKSAANMSKIDL